MGKNYPFLGEILRRLLFEKRIKAADLARELDIPRPTIHRLLTGKSKRPHESSLIPIANFFSISVPQLLGEEPLFKTTNEALNPQPALSKVNLIPLISWASLNDLKNALINAQQQITVTKDISGNCFATLMHDSSMEPLFPKNTILIFDPELTPKDRSFVLVHLHETNLPIFRQILIDADHKYLKPLNPDLHDFKMRTLSKKDVILGCLMESRFSHLTITEDLIEGS